MRVIAVKGITKSGKTTVCETIIAGLRERGYSVGSVKEIHYEGFAIDPDPTANTRRHRTAGSELVTARGIYETDILYQAKLPMEQILKHYDHDYVVLEGVADCNVPLIITAHTTQEVERQLDERAIAVSGVLANTNVQEVFGLPVFNALEDPKSLVDLVEDRAFAPLPSFDPECCQGCGYSCRELAGRIAWQKAKREDCILWSQETELLINGEPIFMVPFVQKILKNAVLGVAQELRGFKRHSTIEVRFKS
ncbi:MAG: molybdopterin-guanine dinucleotide biosynthesis protein [Firmicutes bacterium]|nr:molybdopterin-guanine dinucleotide biosynthesis protein [Bacillota bacterium]